MDAGIYFSLYIVLVNDLGRAGIFFLPRDLQTEEMFIARSPLRQTARRCGVARIRNRPWEGIGSSCSYRGWGCHRIPRHRSCEVAHGASLHDGWPVRLSLAQR